MTSRLERLFVLLEAGAGAATRRAAARQLGEVQRAHPEELHRLLARVARLLRSPAWETRVAASQAVEAILENLPEWHPPPVITKTDINTEPDANCLLRCDTFDIEQVLQKSAHLMGSEGHEYDVDEEGMSPGDIKERLANQRQQLNARLGLDVAVALGVDVGFMCSNEDLCPVTPSPSCDQPSGEQARRPVQELVPSVSSKPLSSREMNVAKRKARQAALCKQKSREDDTTATPPAEPERKKIKLELEEDAYLESDAAAPTPGADGSWGGCVHWPLQAWCGLLQARLLSGAWEARHGAASALRELLRARVSSRAAASHHRHQNEQAHQEWLEDMALRLVCVLALDRFGDFVSDQVVAPVRETCAQTLGVALARLEADRVRGVARLLGTLRTQRQWEARHGALLGLKYLLAARQELACECGALEYLIEGLDDPAEDVSAVAAGALVPAAAALAQARPTSLRAVVNRLWQLLYEQDDLAAPANSYMALLAALMALPQAAKQLHPIDLSDVLPRLWPYLDHSTSSVRKATMQTLRTLTRPLVTETTDNSTDAQDSTRNGEEYLMWTPELLQDAMRHIYQRILFEHVSDIQEIAIQVWHNLVRHAPLAVTLVAACPMLARWLCLAMQPSRAPVDGCLLLQPAHKEKRRNGVALDSIPPELRPSQKHYLGGCESLPQHVREANVTAARCHAANVLGYLSCYLVQPAPGIEYKTEDESPIDCYVKVLTVYLRSGSALQRLVASLVISSWARYTVSENMYPPLQHDRTNGANERNGESSSDKCEKDGKSERDVSTLAPALVSTLHAALNQTLYYDEVALNCNKILQEARDLLAMMKHYKLPLDGEEFTNIIRLEQVIYMCNISKPMVAGMKLKRVVQTLEDRRAKLQTDVTQCAMEQASLNVSVQAALAGAVTNLHCLPEKLNPVVRPLMESIKKESSMDLQQQSAQDLAILLEQLSTRDPCPNAKVLANLKTFLRCDPELTPRVSLAACTEEAPNGDSGSGDSAAEEKVKPEHKGPPLDKYNGILTLWEQHQSAEKVTPKRGRPPATACDLNVDSMLSQEDEGQKLLRIQRRGAMMALNSLTTHFGDKLPEKLPKLWEFIIEPFSRVMEDSEMECQSEESAEELVSRLCVFEAVCASLSAGTWRRVAAGGAALCRLARHSLTTVRHAVARALAALSQRDPAAAAPLMLHQLVPALSAGVSRVRCGAAEALARSVDALKLRAVPYVPLLLVPLMGRMSDSYEPVRVMSTRCFATLIQLMPLDGAVPEPEGLSEELLAQRAQDKKFIEKLFNPKSIEDYKIPVPINAELRSYQQAGVNWLRFLNEYQLHGVLCDDMGLGKTLQSVVVVAGSHVERTRARRPPLPSLVVCPPTLTGHWVFEVNKFVSSKYLKPLQYVGPPVERERLRSQVKHYNLIVASYDIVRKDIEFFSRLKWNYCILDEGHVIKNRKTKAFKAIKQLIANHRLILSGTPIQNNVLELWSLFDFLMPGLLGSERQFTAKYSRPILAAREPRASPLQLQTGARACDALHRQVLPFLLRRVKEDVLKELPPKITQDYYCELSPLQRELYEDFSKSHMPNGIESASKHTHVFQALHYLQAVCNHPALVLGPEHPQGAALRLRLAAQHSSLQDIHHAAKLPALKQLLLDCGIGTASSDSDTEVVVSQHRALIFCQLKKMLDIVEKDLLQRHLPSVSYLRLDGSVPAGNRHSIVTRFNSDPSIDLLLLTTAVGGLGLNLTGADTVIFVEHDWNPTKDLQAMDRAHRIGQKRVVNVYRLITRDTIEEKIMGLQKFKLQTANTVISSENASLETMGTEQLLDLFQLSNGEQGGSTVRTDLLPDLWDDSQYEEEYDMTAYIKGLNKINTAE